MDNKSSFADKYNKQPQYDRYRDNTSHRKALVWWMMAIVSACLIGVLVIVFFSSMLKISDVVTCSLLVTTTANVLGLSKIILNSLPLT